MKRQLKLIASRYLVISYGITSYTHALVYDIVLERLGKLKLEHTDCFEYVSDNPIQVSPAKESIAFLTLQGELKLLDFYPETSADSVVMLGKLQYTRSRTITLLQVDLETIKETASLSVTSLYSLDGKTTQEASSVQAFSADGIRGYSFRVTGINHTIKVEGTFNLTTVLATYLAAGKR